jgi:hypothetical protein
MAWHCNICGAQVDEAPTCFGIDAPWRALVPESAFSQRVELTADQCVVDAETFFIRGHIQVAIRGLSESLSFSVWSSLSEKSFRHITERWESPHRATDPPYFGWLSTPIAVYSNTVQLPLSVQSRAPGLTPVFTVTRADHPLAIDQERGIAIARWHEIAHHILHAEFGFPTALPR